MKRSYAMFLIGCFMVTQAFAQNMENVKEPSLPAAGWENLFDGKTLDNWSFVGLGDFAVEKGTLKSQGKTGLLWYELKKFGNCVVRVVYKVSDPQTSSAVFVLIPHPPVDIWDASDHGYQIKIADYKDPYHRTGSVYSFSPAPEGLSKSAGEWNTMDIFLKNQQVAVYVNGQLASTYKPGQSVPLRQASSDSKRGPRPETGYIGVENHNDLYADVIGQIWFKEIKVLPLSTSESDLSTVQQ